MLAGAVLLLHPFVRGARALLLCTLRSVVSSPAPGEAAAGRGRVPGDTVASSLSLSLSLSIILWRNVDCDAS